MEKRPFHQVHQKAPLAPEHAFTPPAGRPCPSLPRKNAVLRGWFRWSSADFRRSRGAGSWIRTERGRGVAHPVRLQCPVPTSVVRGRATPQARHRWSTDPAPEAERIPRRMPTTASGPSAPSDRAKDHRPHRPAARGVGQRGRHPSGRHLPRRDEICTGDNIHLRIFPRCRERLDPPLADFLHILIPAKVVGQSCHELPPPIDEKPTLPVAGLCCIE